MPKYNLHVMLTVYFNKRIYCAKLMQIRHTNQGLNFDKYLTYENDIDPKQRAWIEVRGKSIETNVRELRSKLSKNCQFMAVVKADGYGHDAKVVSEYAIKGGASELGVATLKEGIKLRSLELKNQFLFSEIFIQKEI